MFTTDSRFEYWVDRTACAAEALPVETAASEPTWVRRSCAVSVRVPPARFDRVFTLTLVPAVSSRFTPLNTALSMKLAACESSWLKSSDKIERCAVVMPSFESSVSF